MDDPQTRERRPVGGGAGVAAASEMHRRVPGDGTPDTIQLRTLAPAAHRRLAPFGREVAEALAAGQSPSLFVFCGPRAWDLAAERRFRHGRGSALVMPAGTPPETILWPRLDSLCLVCDEIPRADALEVARAAVSAGVRAVVALGHDGFLVRSSRPYGWAA